MPHDDDALQEKPQHERFKDWYLEFEEATSEARKRAQRDRQFYDGIQWTDDELTRLKQRRQPPVTINRIAPKVNFVRGVELRTRVDPKAFPITNAHIDDADVATDALRHVADVAKFDKKRSLAVENQLIEGVGGTIVGIEDVRGRPIITTKRIKWNRMWWDPHSAEPDFSDALYTGIVLWRDFDEVKRDPQYQSAEAQESLAVAKSTISNSLGGQSLSEDTHDDRPIEWFDTKRNRIQVFEVYYRDWVTFEDDGGNKVTQMEWLGAHFVGSGMLIPPFAMPWTDDKGFSFNPMTLFSANVDDDNNRYGIVRAMISPQEEINKRRSLALAQFSNKKILMEEGAVQSADEAQLEAAKPDGVVVVNKGALKDGRFVVQSGDDMAQGQMLLYQAAKAEIDEVGPRGTFNERANSGREFSARQEAGAMEMAPVFENIREFTLTMFEKYWWLIRANWGEEMWFRVRDDDERKGYRFVALNRDMTKGERIKEMSERGLPPSEAIEQVLGKKARDEYEQVLQVATQNEQQVAQQAQRPPDPAAVQQRALRLVMDSPAGQGEFTQNDVAKLDVDIKIDTSPDSTILQHEQFEQLVKMMQIMQQAGNQIDKDFLEMVIQAAPNLRDKKRLINKLREPPPQEVVQQQQQQQQLAVAEIMGRIKKLEAEVGLKQAQAAKAAAEAEAEVPKVAAEVQKDNAQATKLMIEAELIAEGVEEPSRGIGNDSPASG